MLCPDLNLDGLGLQITSFAATPSLLVLALASTAATAACPRCGCPSHRVHSHYVRTLADLPCQDRPVALRLTVRRFRCTSPDCTTAVFCERLPQLLDTHMRTTARLADVHRLIGMALGGEAGARLAEEMALPTSPDTILRRVKAYEGEPAPPPRYVGVDDWAIRKGQRYGTILIDLERSRVLDLLPGRDGAALEAWLKEHPGVEVITRDRWAAFAQAATAGAPQAQQVADRWHLLKNLREAVERLLERHTAPLREALKTSAESTTSPTVVTQGPTESASSQPPTVATQGPTEPVSSQSPTVVTQGPTEPVSSQPPADPPVAPRRVSVKEQARQEKRRARAAQYERVQALRAEGQSLRQIARTMGLSVKRVIRYLRVDRCPDWNPGRQTPTTLAPFAQRIDAWIAEGGRNAAELYRNLMKEGLHAS